jgi:carbon monoxide dehydrogenase subunit G
VWDAVWDVPTLASWIPGCTGAEQTGDDTYRVRLEQQISVFKAAFDLVLTVTDVEAPDRIAFHGEGEDRRMGSRIQIDSVVTITPDGPDATTVRYTHDLSIFGRLGAVGFPLIQMRARQVEAEFARRASLSLAG